MKTQNNAMTAKAKAMYGNRLTDVDYTNLVNKNTIPEVVNYLKTQTSYKSVLANVNENTIHRKELEERISIDVFNRFVSLIKYDNSGNKFFNYIVVREEIAQILAVSRSIDIQDNKDLIANLPVYIIEHMSFDIKKLASAKDYDTFILYLKGSKYEPIVRKNVTNNLLDYPTLETDLEEFFSKFMKTLINKFSNVSARNALKDVFDKHDELMNITKIYRMKKFFNANADEIKKVLLDKYKKIPKKDLYRMIDSCNASEFLEEISKGPYGNYFDISNFLYIEHSVQEVMFNINKHNMYFGNNAEVVMMSYIELSKIELSNIIDIIEGIKYKVNKGKITEMLIT
jgi:V/A-type H+-transporting ATPase subunit C